MISLVISHILKEPVRGKKGICHLLVGEFHLGNDKRSKRRLEHVKFNGELRHLFGRKITVPEPGRRNGKQIALFGNNIAVCLCAQMFIGFFVQGKIVLFSGKKPFSFVSKLIVIILPANAENGIGIQISLLNDEAGVLF